MLLFLNFFGSHWFSLLCHLCDFSFCCCNYLSRHHVVPELLLAEILLLDLDAALIAALMVIGLVIAKLETGRTNVTAVEREVI